MSGEELQQHLKEIGDEVDKIVSQSVEPKAEAVSASSASAAAIEAGATDDVPSSGEGLVTTKQVKKFATICIEKGPYDSISSFIS